MTWHRTAAAGQTGGNSRFWLPRGVRVGAGIHNLEEDSALETTIVPHRQRFLLNQPGAAGVTPRRGSTQRRLGWARLEAPQHARRDRCSVGFEALRQERQNRDSP